MEFLSLAPFVPSGKNFEGSKSFFQDLGFQINWDQGDYIGFGSGQCNFILQNYYVAGFAENFMLSVNVSNAQEFYDGVIEKGLVQKYGIRISPPAQQPYGKEVNIIDLAGVCWHFVEN